MAIYASECGVVSASSAAEGQIATTADWVILSCKLSGVAGGDNYLWLGSGGSGMLLEPGDVVGPIVVPPKTTIKVTSTSEVAVSWSYHLTTFPGTVLMGALVSIAGYLNVLACMSNPQAVQTITQDLKRQGLA